MDFQKGATQGDTGWGGMVGQMIGGLNPLVDYRDTVAGVRNIRNNPASLSAWAGFGGALVGWLPVKGDVAKGVILAGRQTAKEVAQAAARSTDEILQATTRAAQSEFPGKAGKIELPNLPKAIENVVPKTAWQSTSFHGNPDFSPRN